MIAPESDCRQLVPIKESAAIPGLQIAMALAYPPLLPARSHPRFQRGQHGLERLTERAHLVLHAQWRKAVDALRDVLQQQLAHHPGTAPLLR